MKMNIHKSRYRIHAFPVDHILICGSDLTVLCDLCDPFIFDPDIFLFKLMIFCINQCIFYDHFGFSPF